MQKPAEKVAKKPRKRRSPWDKEGRFKYLHRKLELIRKETHDGFKKMEARMRALTNTLAPFMEIEDEYIVAVVCRDQADEDLLDYLASKGDLGITPTEACTSQQLRRYRFKPFHITRRIQRMNKRLKQELGKPIAESYHRRWVLTLTAQKCLSSSKGEVEGETAELG